jgi:hypothetical protein
MINIKIILLLPFLALIILILPRLRNKLFFRLGLIAVSGIGVLFVLFPGIPDSLAHMVGVGRGADLVMYIFIVSFFMASIALYSKMKKIEADQTELVRKIAIQRSEKIN